MKKLSKDWPILLFEFIIVVGASFLICHSEYFQSLIAPQKFWEHKVHGLERNLKQLRWRVRELELALEYEKASEDFLLQHAVDRAENFGEDTQAVVIRVKEDHDKKLKGIEAELKLFRHSLIDSEKELQGALAQIDQIADPGHS